MDNPCDKFLGFPRGEYYNGDPRDMWLVAPGTRFHWSSKRIAQYGAPPLSSLDRLR